MPPVSKPNCQSHLGGVHGITQNRLGRDFQSGKNNQSTDRNAMSERLGPTMSSSRSPSQSLEPQERIVRLIYRCFAEPEIEAAFIETWPVVLLAVSAVI